MNNLDTPARLRRGASFKHNMKTEIVGIQAYRHLATVTLDNGFEIELPYHCHADDQAYFADSLEIDGTTVKAVIGESSITDFFEVEGNLLCVTRRWNLTGNFDAHLLFSVMAQLDATAWSVPGVAYASGEAARKKSASLGPVSECRCSIPCCAVVEGKREGVAVFTEPAKSVNDLATVATQLSDDAAEITISTPGATGRLGGASGVWPVEGHISFERKYYIYTDANYGDFLNNAIHEAWRILFFPPESRYDWSAAVAAKALHLAEDFFIERGDAIGFVEEIGPSGFPRSTMLATGKAGGNIEAARSLYRIGCAVENKWLRRISLDTADFFLSVDREMEELRFDYHPATRKWIFAGDERKLLRGAGELLLSITRLHRVATPGDTNPRWLYTAKKIADRLFDRWRVSAGSGDAPDNNSKRNGKSSDQLPLCEEAFPAAAFVELYRETEQQDYLEAAEWLGGRLVLRLRTAVSPVRQEELPLSSTTAHAFLRAFLLLHEETDRAEYLDAAVKTAEYMRSLCFIHKGIVPTGSRLAKAGFSTVGGLAVEPGSDWLSPCGAVAAPDLLKLWKQTGDRLWRDIAVLILEFSSRLIHPPEDRNGTPPARGRQPARFYHCPIRGSRRTWGTAAGVFSSVPAVTLGALLDVHESFPEILDLRFDDMGIAHTRGDIIPRSFRYIGSFINFF